MNELESLAATLQVEAPAWKKPPDFPEVADFLNALSERRRCILEGGREMPSIEECLRNVEQEMRAFPTVGCSCCGKEVRNHPNENADLEDLALGNPKPGDCGYGKCRDCGGQPGGLFLVPKGATEAEVRWRCGFEFCCFIDARVDVVAQNLESATTKEKWAALSYEHKCYRILQLLDRGVLQW